VAVWPARELPDEYLDQLIEKSREPHILEYETQGTKKPSRFLDRETYRAWAARRERIIYLLLHESDREPLEVAGVIWFGPKACPLGEPEFARYDVTFSIRLYESSRGKGLSRPFIEAAHADVLEHYYPGHDLWLDTGKDNEAAHRSYLKFGYQVLGEHGDRIVMGYSA
jgi:GNAT superfamily N-acetyltransferase